jgi:hypothetical protein
VHKERTNTKAEHQVVSPVHYMQIQVLQARILKIARAMRVTRDTGGGNVLPARPLSSQMDQENVLNVQKI